MLVQWILHHAEMGMPYLIKDLQAEAAKMAGREPGRQWHRRFLKKFPEIQPLKGTKLDPKHAKHFNEAIINDYFDQLEHLHAHFSSGIPP